MGDTKATRDEKGHIENKRQREREARRALEAWRADRRRERGQHAAEPDDGE